MYGDRIVERVEVEKRKRGEDGSKGEIMEVDMIEEKEWR